MINKQIKSMSVKHQVVVGAMEKGKTGRRMGWERVSVFTGGNGNTLCGNQFFFFFNSYLKTCSLILERAEERERERERERNQSVASCTPQLRTEPATQACAMTGN